jgi:hypothetical protein
MSNTNFDSKDLEKNLKYEARLSAIEHMLTKTLATILAVSGKSPDDVDALEAGTTAKIRQMVFGGLNPALSDALAAELEDAVSDLHKLLKKQLELALKKAD